MDLDEALRAIDTPVVIPGTSDDALVARVGRRGGGKPNWWDLAVARGLNGEVRVRPVDAMQRLAAATALELTGDIFAEYQWWARMRYIGAFAEPTGPGDRIRLSGAAARVRGNQRRVMSEELGVGFGVLLAEEWCRAMGAIGPISAIDVDQALQIASFAVTIADGEERQPDYLLQYPDPHNPGSLVFKLLECKGTNNAAYAPTQLARAATQLSSLLVGGRPIQGVAISTISSAGDTHFLAVDPDAEEHSWRPSDDAFRRAREHAPEYSRYTDQVSVDEEELFAAAAAASLGALAAYAGDIETADRWMPRSFASKRRAIEPIRVRETGLGDFVGQEIQLSLPGESRQLRVFHGLHVSVRDALDSAHWESVRVAQAEFAANVSRTGRPPGTEGEVSRVASVSAEGSILILDALG